jgi:molybdopterin-binding protein
MDELPAIDTMRLGQAAEILRVSVDTLRRWEAEGRLTVIRSPGGQRQVPLTEVTRLAAERRAAGATERPTVARSARNTFRGIVTRVEADRIAAVVEVQAGPHRLVSLMTAEAVAELGLRVGDEAVCVIKATNVIVEVPARRDGHAP